MGVGLEMKGELQDPGLLLFHHHGKVNLARSPSLRQHDCMPVLCQQIGLLDGPRHCYLSQMAMTPNLK